MGTRMKTMAELEEEERRRKRTPAEEEERGFAADLRRLKATLVGLAEGRTSLRQGLRTQGAVGLVARADATLPPRKLSKLDGKETEEDVRK